MVIVSFWGSVQLRKKLCYFTIMVLSCCDLHVVLTRHPLKIFCAMLWFSETLNGYPRWLYTSLRSSVVFVAFSLNVLVMMSFERYLGTSYPIFHRTSVTKAKLSTLFAILNITTVFRYVFSLSFNDCVISYEVSILIGFTIHFPPMLFFNYKLFMVARKSRRNNKISPTTKKSFFLKNISSCVLAVACFVVLFIPVSTYVGLRKFSNDIELFLNDTTLTGLWTATISSMNSTFSCLIF